MKTISGVQISVEQDTVRLVSVTRGPVILDVQAMAKLMDALAVAADAAKVNDSAMRSRYVAARGNL